MERSSRVVFSAVWQWQPSSARVQPSAWKPSAWKQIDFLFYSFPRFSATLKKGRRAAYPFVVLSFYTRCFDRSSKVFQLGISLRRVSQAGIAVRVVARMASNASSW